MNKASVALIVFILGFGFSKGLRAQTCSEVFPSALASSSPTSSIDIAYGANVYNAPDNQIVTRSLSQGDSGCGDVACVQSNTLATEPAPYTHFPGGSSVYMQYRETRDFTPQHFRSFGTNSEAVVNLAPGDYSFQRNVNLGYKTVINISAPGTVRLFIDGQFDTGSEVQINLSGGTDRFLYIYANNHVDLGYRTQVKAAIYTGGKFTLATEATLTGAVTAEKNVTIHYGAALTFDKSMVDNTDFGASCDGQSPPVLSIDVGSVIGSTCHPLRVAISVRDSSGSVINDYTGRVSLLTSTGNGDWSKTNNSADANGDFTPGANDSGAAHYEFTAADGGTATLFLHNSHKESLTITASDAAAAVSVSSAPLSFADNVFVIEATDVLADDVIAGRDHQFRAMLVRSDPTTGVCGVAADYNQSQVKAWLRRAASDPGGQAPLLLAGTTQAPLPNAEPASANTTLQFNGGIADFALRTEDVGRYALQLKDTSLSFADQSLVGGSSMLVARPFALRLTVADNAASASASGGVFRSAGSAFEVTVQAVAWQQEDDQDGDGIADNVQDLNPSNNANLANNLVLASFGRESPAVQIQLSADLLLPVTGHNPGLAGGDLFAAAQGTTQVRFDEVGVIQIRAALAQSMYLGAGRGDRVRGVSGYVGRFVPERLVVSDAVLEPACDSALGFTYFSENFTARFTVSAVNAMGITTVNYQGDFAKLDALAIHQGFFAADDSRSLTQRLGFSASNAYLWQEGRLPALAGVSVARDLSLEPPTVADVGIALRDTDGVAQAIASFDMDSDLDTTPDSQRLGSTALRFGRLVLADSFGPETANLPVRFTTEYWSGSEWQRNNDDSCTAIALSNIKYPRGDLLTQENWQVAVGSGFTEGVYANKTAEAVKFSRGDAQHYFTAPGAGNTGAFNVDVDLAGYPWLQFDWDGDGVFAESTLPQATYTFGAYRGHDRILYWLEELR